MTEHERIYNRNYLKEKRKQWKREGRCTQCSRYMGFKQPSVRCLLCRKRMSTYKRYGINFEYEVTRDLVNAYHKRGMSRREAVLRLARFSDNARLKLWRKYQAAL